MDLERERKRQAPEIEGITREGDLVNHPSHYKKDGKECIDVMEEKYGTLAVINFCECNAFKYRWRAGSKAGNPAEQDEAKAQWYERKAEELRKKILLPE